MPAISYSNPDHLCLGRIIFVVIIDPAGPFMLYIFGPAGPFMHPDHIFLYRTSKVPKQRQALPPGNQLRHSIWPLIIITTYTHRLQNSGYTPRHQSTTDSQVSLTAARAAACRGIRPPQQHRHKYKYVLQQWESRHNPRAIRRDSSSSSLVPKEGTGRVPSHAPDSDEATDSKRAFVFVNIRSRIQKS